MTPAEMIRNGRRYLLPAEEHVVHAAVIVIVVIAASILRGTGHLDNSTVSIVFGTAIGGHLGYAAGRTRSNGKD
jgi:membrane protease YdiL (CAAX protease family)